MNRGLRKELSMLAGLAALGLTLKKNKTPAALLALAAAGLRLMPSPAFSFANRSVVITGGSRGLGFALAKEFLSEGAQVALLARDPLELGRAEVRLLESVPSAADGKVMGIPCDITKPDSLKQAFMQVETQFGGIDILVNNAGSIAVGPFDTMTQADFDSQINLQLNAVVRGVQLALPAFRRAGGGRIVNISSIGGRLPVPHMSTYCAGKFALAGLSGVLAAELAPENVKVTTVYPGMMHTGSPIQAVFKGDHEKEFAWFLMGNLSPVISIAARDAARKIVEGVRNGDTEVAFPKMTRFSFVGQTVLPETYALIMRTVNRLLPGGHSPVRKTGAESQYWLEHRLWYQPFRGIEDEAEARFNQVEKFDADFNLGVATSLR